MDWRRCGALGAVALSALVAGCSKQADTAVSASAAAPAPAASTAAAVVAAQVTVPFVGCASDGQVGPQAAPGGGPVTITADPAAAKQLAYYVMTNGPGVLAPAGWSCAGVYGSDGATLVVAPQPLTPAVLINNNWKGASGDAVTARIAEGDTSGRSQVAEVIARVFPAEHPFVQGIIDNGQGEASDFPSGPYPTDALTNKATRTIEYQTPAKAVGLGTDASSNNRLVPGADPVSGAAILTGQTPDLAIVAARLPATSAALATVIVQRFETDNPESGAPTAGAPPPSSTPETNHHPAPPKGQPAH